MPGLIRYTDPLPLRDLAPKLLEALDEVAEPGGMLEELLGARPRPDALVVIILDARGALGASLATWDGDLVVSAALERVAEYHRRKLREAVTAAAKARWKDWEPRSTGALHAA